MKRAAGLLLGLLLGGHAMAADYLMSFSAHSFVPLWGTTTAPSEDIGGEVRWTADPDTGAVVGVTAINVSIGGHKFELSDVTYLNGGATTSVIGGLHSGANGISAGTADFILTFDRTGLFYNFFYTLPGAATVWFTQAPNGDLSISAVPETSSVALMLAGGCVLVAARKGRGRRNASAD